jgi:hypothetical protein
MVANAPGNSVKGRRDDETWILRRGGQQRSYQDEESQPLLVDLARGWMVSEVARPRVTVQAPVALRGRVNRLLTSKLRHSPMYRLGSW